MKDGNIIRDHSEKSYFKSDKLGLKIIKVVMTCHMTSLYYIVVCLHMYYNCDSLRCMELNEILHLFRFFSVLKMFSLINFFCKKRCTFWEDHISLRKAEDIFFTGCGAVQ